MKVKNTNINIIPKNKKLALAESSMAFKTQYQLKLAVLQRMMIISVNTFSPFYFLSYQKSDMITLVCYV